MTSEETKKSTSENSMFKNIAVAVGGGIVGYMLAPKSSSDNDSEPGGDVIYLPDADLPIEDQQPLIQTTIEEVVLREFSGFAITPTMVKSYVDRLATQVNSELSLGVSRLIPVGILGNYISDLTTSASDGIRSNIKRRYASLFAYSVSRGKSLENEAGIHVLIDKNSGLIGSTLKAAPLIKGDFAYVYPDARNRSRNKVSNPYAFIAKGLNTILSVVNDGGTNVVGDDVTSIMQNDPNLSAIEALMRVDISSASISVDGVAQQDLLNYLYSLNCNIYVNPYSNLFGWIYGSVSEGNGVKFKNVITKMPW